MPTTLEMELAYSVLIGHFEPVYLLQLSKNDDENVASKSNLALFTVATHLRAAALS